MTPGGLELGPIRVRKTGGLQYPLTIHRNVAGFLAGCDGNRTLRQVLEVWAHELGLDWDRALPVVLPAVRSLIERGVLLPLDPSQAEA